MSDEAERTLELLGLKFVDDTGQGLAPEMMQLIVEALAEAGQISLDPDTGLLVVANDCADGRLIQLSFDVEDGEVVAAEASPFTDHDS